MNKLIAFLLLAGAVAAPQAFAQQAYPSKPVHYIVPFAAGGLTDNIARIVGQKLAELWQQSVVVENRAGGNANIGAEAAAKAPADGYTLLGITMTHAVNASLFEGKLAYDLQRDFVPVAQYASSPLVLVVNATRPVNSVKEFVAWAKTKPLNYGSSGNGTPPHLGMELFSGIAGLRLTHIPYKGGAPAVADLLGGQTDVIFANLPEVISQVKAGKLRALAVSGKARNPLLPDVPTLQEAGYTGFDVQNWAGLLVPARTPADVVARISADIGKVITLPEVRQKLEDQGFVVSTGTPREFEGFLGTEVRKWARVVKDAGINPG